MGSQPICRLPWHKSVFTLWSRSPWLQSLSCLPVLAQIGQVCVRADFQPWVRGAHGIDSLQAGWNKRVHLTCPVVTTDAFGQRYFPAASAPAGMALRSSALPFVSKVSRQVKLDVHSPLPFFLWHWLPPLNTTVVACDGALPHVAGAAGRPPQAQAAQFHVPLPGPGRKDAWKPVRAAGRPGAGKGAGGSGSGRFAGCPGTASARPGIAGSVEEVAEETPSAVALDISASGDEVLCCSNKAESLAVSMEEEGSH
eukprot:225835-Amphidinium_carterae.3